MMFNTFSKILFIIFVSHHFLNPFSSAIPLVEDNMLIAVMKGHQQIQISEYSVKKNEKHLGIMHYMRKNWKCDKIGEKFEEFERTECQKYRKYFDILYEYLGREYVGIPTVKPKFVFKREIEIEGPIIYAVFCLASISQFYFIKNVGEQYEYKLDNLFNLDDNFEPKLLNQKRLKYEIKNKNEQKMPINEMILQLAIDTANEWQTNEIVDEIIQQRFKENLGEIFEKADECAKKANCINYDQYIKYDKHQMLMESNFHDQFNWIYDALFSAYIKGQATNSEKFFKMAKEYSNYLYRVKENENIDKYNYFLIAAGICKIEKIEKHWTQTFEAHLGVMYLMRENWQCDQIGEEFEEKCRKYRKYLDILYEYLFRLYAEAKNPKVSKQLPPLVKPIFIDDFPDCILKVVSALNDHSKYFWKKNENELENLELVNEEEFNNEIKEEKNCENCENSSTKSEIEIANLRKEFEQKIKKLCENTKENVREEESKLEKAKETENENRKLFSLKKVYDYKFGTFISSPFS